MKRREFLGILGGSAVAWPTVVLGQQATSPGAPASGRTDTLRVGKAGRDAFSFVPADIGVETGIFRKHGVDLQISSFGGDARIQQAMTADGIDVALGSGPGLAFIVKGSPVKGIAAMAGPPLLFALMVRADDSIKSVDDLKGRNVGVSTVGSVTSWIVSEVSRQKGWGFGGIAQVPIGDDATRIAAANEVSRCRDRQSRRRSQIRPARRGTHPASLQ
jgi:ABC-type nitrate/sulfonate/bicarbonate transport system substrate-binding protein